MDAINKEVLTQNMAVVAVASTAFEELANKELREKIIKELEAQGYTEKRILDAFTVVEDHLTEDEVEAAALIYVEDFIKTTMIGVVDFVEQAQK
jgi:hypothetical protein